MGFVGQKKKSTRYLLLNATNVTSVKLPGYRDQVSMQRTIKQNGPQTPYRKRKADEDRWFKGGTFTQVGGSNDGVFKKPALPPNKKVDTGATKSAN